MQDLKNFKRFLKEISKLSKIDKETFLSRNKIRRLGLKKVGKDVRISKFTVIRYPEEVSIGSHVAIDPFVYISVRMDIGNRVHIEPFVGISGAKPSYSKLEDYTFLSEGVKLICGTDDYSGEALINPVIPMKYRKVTYGEIILKKFSGLATGVIVLPNVIIGEGSVVGAHSLVTQSLKPWGIYYGIPAIRKKERKRKKILQFAAEIEAEEKK